MADACAACGSAVGVERHHLYPKSMGCPDDLTVPLCHDCHGRTHQMRRRVNISEATREGLRAAKERGTKLGTHAKPKRAVRALAAAGGEVAKAKADARAESLRWAIEGALKEAGSYSGAARLLNERGVASPRGGRWYPMGVSRMVERLGLGAFPGSPPPPTYCV